VEPRKEEEEEEEEATIYDQIKKTLYHKTVAK
jgi:hypothetical protein